jgi:hypothetical protein
MKPHQIMMQLKSMTSHKENLTTAKQNKIYQGNGHKA